MCKNAENGAKLPISTKYAVEMARGHRTGGTGNARWPFMRFWETAPGQRAWDNSGEL